MSPRAINIDGIGEVYQDVWADGQLIHPGVRSCEGRYEAIREWLKQYERPFTVLDIGACLGYFCTRILEDFEHASAVAVESKPQYQRVLKEIGSAYDGYAMIPRRIGIDVLQKWSMCEHFDVILALSIVHHFPGSMLANIKALQSLGRNLLLEIPVKGESACNQGTINKEYDQVIKYLDTVGYRLTTTVSHTTTKVGRKEVYKRPLYWVPGTWIQITRSMIDKPRAKYKLPVRIDADYRKADYESKGRELGVSYHEKRPLIHGFNLYNLLRLEYAMPSPEHMVSQIKTMKVIGQREDRDLRPWNMIWGRDGVTLIDERPNGLNEGWDAQLERCIKGIREGVTDPWWFHGRKKPK